MRLPLQKMMQVLRKLYKYENGRYDGERQVSVYDTQTLSEKDQVLLSQSGWQANDIVSFSSHDDIITRLHSLKNNTALTRERCISAFIAGVGGSYLRGRSVLSAFHKLNTLPVHTYLEKLQYACCWVCGDHNTTKYINDSYFQYCLYYGNAYSSTALYAYLNLRHLLTTEPVTPTDQDNAIFRQLLDMLRNAPEDETPGQFEKRLKASKLIAGDRYTLRGILQSLALTGVIPNQFMTLSLSRWTDFGDIVITENQLKNTKGRSDMEMPWAGWKGNLRINDEKAAGYFDGNLNPEDKKNA
ncbi:hypothetical protein ABQJ53_02020 [Morganella morganii]|uniref:hypothetical protein n=1 Tax=Morganella morganii TaxID=582 RepID=UPI003F21F677